MAIENSLDNIKTKFPEARVGFSEILYIGRSNRSSSQNKSIDDVNSAIKQYCDSNGFTYIKHERLQSGESRWYDDDVHVNSRAGTAILCSDIYDAIGSRVRREGNVDTRSFYGRERSHQHSTFTRRNENSSRRHREGPVNVDTSRIGPNNLDSMIKVLTLNMLRSMQS